jgi:hypothetical protein
MTATLEQTETINGVEFQWLGEEVWVADRKALTQLKGNRKMNVHLCAPVDPSLSPIDTYERYCVEPGTNYYVHQTFVNDEWI